MISNYIVEGGYTIIKSLFMDQQIIALVHSKSNQILHVLP